MTVEIAAQLALIRAGLIVAKYSPDQARDEQGRWTSGGVHVMAPDAGGYGGDIITLSKPPIIGGGATNPQYQKRAEKMHALAAAGNMAGLEAEAKALAEKVAASSAKLKQNSHDRWNAKLSAYADKLVGELKQGAVQGGYGDAKPPPPPPPAVSPPPPPPPPLPPVVQPTQPKAMVAEFPLGNIEAKYSTVQQYVKTNKAKLDKLPPDHLAYLQKTKLSIAGSMKGYNAAGLFSPMLNRVSLGKSYVDSDEVLYHEFGHALDNQIAVTSYDPAKPWVKPGDFAATRDQIYRAAVAEEHATLHKLHNSPDKMTAWEAKSLKHFTSSVTESFAQGYAALFAPPDSKESRVQRTRRLMPKTIEAVRDFLARRGLTVPPITWTAQHIAKPPPPPPPAFKPYPGYTAPA